MWVTVAILVYLSFAFFRLVPKNTSSKLLSTIPIGSLLRVPSVARSLRPKKKPLREERQLLR